MSGCLVPGRTRRPTVAERNRRAGLQAGGRTLREIELVTRLKGAILADQPLFAYLNFAVSQIRARGADYTPAVVWTITAQTLSL